MWSSDLLVGAIMASAGERFQHCEKVTTVAGITVLQRFAV
jgi:hypothetical protein